MTPKPRLPSLSKVTPLRALTFSNALGIVFTSVFSLSSENAVISPVAVKSPLRSLPLFDKFDSPTSAGVLIVQFKVTDPLVPPPDIPVPAVTPVMSPTLEVNGKS